MPLLEDRLLRKRFLIVITWTGLCSRRPGRECGMFGPFLSDTHPAGGCCNQHESSDSEGDASLSARCTSTTGIGQQRTGVGERRGCLQLSSPFTPSHRSRSGSPRASSGPGESVDFRGLIFLTVPSSFMIVAFHSPRRSQHQRLQP